MDFVHLHVHSHYSLLDGGNRIGPLVHRARQQGMSALALTDHGNLFGAIEFYRTAREAGLKPILGMEAYISPTTRQDRTAGGIDGASYHLLLLAMNETGWRNLMRLSSRAFLEGFYYRPRVDRELLAQFSGGLICTTACLGGEVPDALLREQEGKARRIAGEYRDIFGPDRFFIEIQNQGEAEQDRVNPGLIRLAKDLGVGLVGTNDVHFLRREDKRSHEVLTCISTGKKLTDQDLLHYSQELYLKSPAEMETALGMWPEALRNTTRIADMCDLKLDFKKHLPVYRASDGATPEAHLRKLAWEGLAARFGEAEPPESYRKRLDWELEVIEQKGYSSYFLIVNDFVQYARRHHIPASPRGSGVATLLGYALGVADVDPIRYGLLFERFTDPQRQEDPDVDIDICQDGRERVIQYVREKYGHVAQIITYGTLKARAAIRDVGRVLDWPLDEVDRLAKLIPEGPRSSLERALGLREAGNEEEQKLFSPDLRKAYETDLRTRELVDHALSIEGLARHAGVHAAGVVVCDEPLETLVPLYRQADSPDAITQWDGPTCEKAGMMKMDILGLKTLTVIQRAREMVQARTGQDVDPSRLPLDDQEVFGLFQRGETDAVFQFESDGMKNVLLQMRPNRIEDLIAANAMYRPGPMRLISDYCRRKSGLETVEKIHPLVDDILAETYGIMIYQEQVMLVLNRLGELPLSRALTLIKAISKKKKEVIDKERPAFVEGAGRNGIEPAESERLFELILKFAGYGFNKAHSTGYAIIAYQTAWFKFHHPREFWAATLTCESSDQDKIVQYMADAKRMGIEIAPPDINTSQSQFTVDGSLVRFGLMAVKGVGEAAVEAILQARGREKAFRDLFHFCGNVDLRAVNRATIEALVKCGAFDRAGGAHRAALAAALDPAIQAGQSDARDRLAGQMNLFDRAGMGAESAPQFPRVPPWSRDQMIKAEKETLGFYVTAHPLDEFTAELRGLNWPRGFHLGRADETPDRSTVACGVLITSVRPHVTAAGKRMAFFNAEDLNGRCEGVLFSDPYEQCGALLCEGALLQVRGTLERNRQRGRAGNGGGAGDAAGPAPKPSLMAVELVPLQEAAARFAAAVVVRFAQSEVASPERGRLIAETLAQHAGRVPVKFHVVTDPSLCRYFVMEPGRDIRVQPGRALADALRQRCGALGVGYEGRPVELPARRRRFPERAVS